MKVVIKITINERIKFLRTQILKNENGKSYSRNDFAMLLSVTRGVIENIEYNRTEVKDNVIKLICLTFNVNEDWLRNGVEPIFKEDSKEKPLIQLLEEEYNIKPIAKKIIEVYLSLGEEEQTMFENFAKKVFEECNVSFNESNIVQIPKYTLKEENPIDDELNITEIDEVKLYDLPVSAGTGTYLFDGVSYELITIDRRFYPKADFALRVSGDSMEPRFYDGDIIYIQSTNDIDNGKIGIFYYNDEAYLKKLKKENGNICLISLNEKYPPIEVDNDSFKVVGIVL